MCTNGVASNQIMYFKAKAQGHNCRLTYCASKNNSKAPLEIRWRIGGMMSSISPTRSWTAYHRSVPRLEGPPFHSRLVLKLSRTKRIPLFLTQILAQSSPCIRFTKRLISNGPARCTMSLFEIQDSPVRNRTTSYKVSTVRTTWGQ